MYAILLFFDIDKDTYNIDEPKWRTPRKEPMKKTNLFAFSLAATTILAGCSIVKSFERDLSYEVSDGTSTWQHGTINIFNNAVLPHAPERTGVKFYRYHIGASAFDLKTTPEAELYPDAGLLRYKDVLTYAVDGVLRVTPIYLSLDEYPRPYLNIGWYDRSRTSKVDQSTIDAWKPDLDAFLAGYGASEEEIADVMINPYGGGGAVADLGAAVNKDGTVDILLGVGNNIDSSSGANVAIVEKYQITLQDSTAWRYIALLNDRPQARAVYEWLKSFEGHKALTGE